MSRLFDNSASDYLEYAGGEVVTTPLTMAAWVYHDETTTQCAVSVADSTLTGDFFELQCTNAHRAAAVASHLASSATASSGTGTINTWQHICAVFASATSRTAYIDGAGGSANTTSKVPAFVTPVTSIGRVGASTPLRYFSGRICEVAIWNAALTAAEVLLIAQGYPPYLVRSDLIWCYVPLHGRISPEPSIFENQVSAVANPTFTVTGTVVADHAPVRRMRGKQVSYKPGISTSPGVGSSAGVGTALGIAASTVRAVGSSAGVGTALGVAASTVAAVGSSAGTSVATGVGASRVAAVGSSAGVGAALGVAASTVAAVGSSAGVGAALGVAASTVAAVGSSAGVGTALGVAASTVAAVGSSAGVGAALGVGDFTEETTPEPEPTPEPEVEDTGAPHTPLHSRRFEYKKFEDWDIHEYQRKLDEAKKSRKTLRRKAKKEVAKVVEATVSGPARDLLVENRFLELLKAQEQLIQQIKDDALRNLIAKKQAIREEEKRKKEAERKTLEEEITRRIIQEELAKEAERRRIKKIRQEEEMLALATTLNFL